MICFKEKFGKWKAMAGALLGISIAFVDFDNLAWSTNMKSYIGFFYSNCNVYINFSYTKKGRLNKEGVE